MDPILTKNWWVKVDSSNIDVLSKWRFGKGDSKLDLSHITGMVKYKPTNTYSKGHNPYGSFKGEHFDYGINNEITFEQFKYHILKEKPAIINYDCILRKLNELNIK